MAGTDDSAARRLRRLHRGLHGGTSHLMGAQFTVSRMYSILCQIVANPLHSTFSAGRDKEGS